jgi:hypothetical protein
MIKRRIYPKLTSRENENLLRTAYCLNKDDVREAYKKYIGFINYEIKGSTDEEIEEMDHFCDLYGYEYVITSMTAYNTTYRRYMQRWKWLDGKRHNFLC